VDYVAAIQTVPSLSFYHFLGGIAQRPQPTTAASSAWLVGLAPLHLAPFFGGLVLPACPRVLRLALPLFIVGIAMAEATCFLAFSFSHTQAGVIYTERSRNLSVHPSFARRYFTQDDEIETPKD
jgi:hypothetical protein